MNPFSYTRASSVLSAALTLERLREAKPLAGGTNPVDLRRRVRSSAIGAKGIGEIGITLAAAAAANAAYHATGKR
jgi:CO/xanthine dehydrogenase FAD-binding subunit